MAEVVFQPEKISLEQAFSTGWQHTKRQFFPLLKVMAVSGGIPLVLWIVFLLFGFLIPKDQQLIKFAYEALTGIITLVVGAILEMGMIYVRLRIIDGYDAEVKDLFAVNRLLFKYMMSNFFYTFMLVWGFIFFVYPGILVSIGLQFYSYFLIDTEIGPIEAIRASWIASRHSRINIALMMLFFWALQGVGTAMLAIGLIPVNMIIGLATADVYRQLFKNTAPQDFSEISGLTYLIPSQDDYDIGHKPVQS